VKKKEIRSQTVIPCMNVTNVRIYLNTPEVQKAIAVAPQSQKFAWDVCSSHLNYDYSAETVLPIYGQLWDKKRILVYSGDVDSCVPYTGTQNAIDSLELYESVPWRVWIVNDQVAGYVKVFGGDPVSNGITYATVKNSGHMVPTYQPEAALVMFSSFINDVPLPQ